MQQEMTWYNTHTTVIMLTDSQIVYGVIDIYCGLDEIPSDTYDQHARHGHFSWREK